jgi:hypothetical protein
MLGFLYGMALVISIGGLLAPSALSLGRLLVGSGTNIDPHSLFLM